MSAARLVCIRCGGDVIVHGTYRGCKRCSNEEIDGRKSRYWKGFREVTPKEKGAKRKGGARQTAQADAGDKPTEAPADNPAPSITEKDMAKKQNKKKTCSVRGCKRTVYKQGYCYRHLIEKHGKEALPPSVKRKKEEQPEEGAGSGVTGSAEAGSTIVEQPVQEDPGTAIVEQASQEGAGRAAEAGSIGSAAGERSAESRLRTCRVCGCTDDHACEGGCYWVAEDLCSQCAFPAAYMVREIEYRETRKRDGERTESTVCIRADIVSGDPDVVYNQLVEWTQRKLDSTIDLLEGEKKRKQEEYDNLCNAVQIKIKELENLIKAKAALNGAGKLAEPMRQV